MGAMSERPLFPLFDLPAWMKQRGVCRKPEDIGPAQKQVTGDGVVRFVGADLPPCSGTDPWLRPKTKAPPGHEVLSWGGVTVYGPLLNLCQSSQ
jgi:hypothetical protein